MSHSQVLEYMNNMSKQITKSDRNATEVYGLGGDKPDYKTTGLTKLNAKPMMGARAKS